MDAGAAKQRGQFIRRQRPPGTQFPDDGADGVALGASAKTANLYSQGFREIRKLYGLRRGLYGLSLRLYGLARLFTGPGKGVGPHY